LLSAEYKSATATGYRQWLEYKNDKLSKDEYIAKWITAEKQYAKRQKTWFKKTINCTWLTAGSPENYSKVVQMIENW
jgi:tRNA dimethylallyltransferase